MKRLVVFDLDGTLAESKAAIDPEMSNLLHRLVGVVRVAVISGGDWPQFDKQVIGKLPKDDRLQYLSILPTCGTKFYRYEKDWEKLYSEDFTDAERKKIMDALKTAIDKSKFDIPKTWGDQIEDRGSQITFSALGQQAPLDEKKKWDPDFEKRKKMQAIMKDLIPEFSINLGGATSVDVTKPGIDKAYGIGKLRDILGIAIDEMVFVGDALFPGGNDYPAEQAGVDSIKVTGPEVTKRVIQAITLCVPASVQ